MPQFTTVGFKVASGPLALVQALTKHYREQLPHAREEQGMKPLRWGQKAEGNKDM